MVEKIYFVFIRNECYYKEKTKLDTWNPTFSPELDLYLNVEKTVTYPLAIALNLNNTPKP
jgi:hypothetical protein